MLDMEDIYCYFVSKLTQLEFSEICLRETDIHMQLHDILHRAETMHLYVGFQEENANREEQGLPPLKLEEEFYGRTAEEIRFLLNWEGAGAPDTDD